MEGKFKFQWFKSEVDVSLMFTEFAFMNDEEEENSEFSLNKIQTCS